MPTEVWFRDPFNYVRELVECNQGRIAWNRGVIAKRRIDPVAWASLYYGAEANLRQILIGDQGSVEVGPDRGLERPLAVYPTWVGGDDLQFLEEMMASNVGDNTDACFDLTVPVDERPVFGQEHRVVITNIPPTSSGPGRNLVRTLKILQEDYPKCKLMIHGLYGYKMAFGMGFAAADMEPRTAAAKGKLMLPGGGDSSVEALQGKVDWITTMGMTLGQMDVPRNRCIYNIKSAVWAGENLDKLYNRARTKTSQPVDITTPDRAFVPPKGLAISRKAQAQDGDKVICSSCTLSLQCMSYREGEVCSLPDGGAGELAKFFGTRDSQSIVDGLAVLMQMGARRLETAASNEEFMSEVDPAVTKMINNLFSQGVTLAKLIDPSLRGGGVKVQVGVVNGTATATVTAANNPNELVGNVMRTLEQKGIPRDKITPELVMATLQGMASPENAHRAIESTVILEEGK